MKVTMTLIGASSPADISSRNLEYLEKRILPTFIILTKVNQAHILHAPGTTERSSGTTALLVYQYGLHSEGTDNNSASSATRRLVSSNFRRLTEK